MKVMHVRCQIQTLFSKYIIKSCDHFMFKSISSQFPFGRVIGNDPISHVIGQQRNLGENSFLLTNQILAIYFPLRVSE